METSTKKLVLVTGAAGYVAGYVIKGLLEANYRVRGTVRKLSDKAKYTYLYQFPGADSLEIVEADLSSPEEAWEKVCQGCEYVMHVASPNITKSKNPEAEIIKPAIEGTVKVLRAALKARAKKVVVTSSAMAVFSGHGTKTSEMLFDEQIWANADQCAPYEKSKTLAEREVWKFYEENKSEIQITVLNPGLILGPALSAGTSASMSLIIRLMTNNVPGIPKLAFPIVDVRDVARAHISSIDNPESDGKRILLVTKTMWFADIAMLLKGEFAKQGYKVSTGKVGLCLLKTFALIDADLKFLIPLIGKDLRFNTTLSQKALKMVSPIEAEKSIIETAYSLIELGVIPKKHPKNSVFCC